MSEMQCKITGLSKENHTQNKYVEEYFITCNSHRYKLRVSKENWNDINSNINSNILKGDLRIAGMFFNNEWQIQNDILITKNLIGILLHLAEYPRNFEEKLNYYLLKCYRKGAFEYRKIPIEPQEYLSAYAHNEEEYNRIIQGLQSKKLIQLSESKESTFILTEDGI